MTQKIYVGNLSYSTSEENLTEIFSAYGEVVSAVIIKDRATGQSKGFGFMEMADSGSAESAIDSLNGTDLDGRNIRVNPAEDKPRPSR